MRIAVAGGLGVVGSHVVAAAEAADHDVVILSRRTGVDVRTGDGLGEALEGVDVVIDVLNSPSQRRAAATEFFEHAAAQLLRHGERAGVKRLVTLSIVGIDDVSGWPYYAAKLIHERVSLAGGVPATMVRATQFHEFAGQVLASVTRGPVATVPRMRIQPIAARTVGAALVSYAEAPPTAVTVELAGPRVHELPDLCRRLIAARQLGTKVVPVPVPGAAGRAMRTGALLPGSGAVLAGPTFEDWLDGPDPDAVLSQSQ